LLGTSFARPIQAKYLVQVAEKEGADAVAHGCTGKGNDQVRFDVTAMALNPGLEVIAPVREWSMKSRDEEIEYAKRHNIPITVTKESPYSIDANLWGRSIECGVLEDPWTEPVNMGEEINSPESENRPSVTPDGKYFFFTSNKTGNREIYWVDAKIIDRFRPKQIE